MFYTFASIAKHVFTDPGDLGVFRVLWVGSQEANCRAAIPPHAIAWETERCVIRRAIRSIASVSYPRGSGDIVGIDRAYRSGVTAWPGVAYLPAPIRCPLRTAPGDESPFPSRLGALMQYSPNPWKKYELTHATCGAGMIESRERSARQRRCPLSVTTRRLALLR